MNNPKRPAHRPRLYPGGTRRVNLSLDQGTLDTLTEIDPNRSAAIRKLAVHWQKRKPNL